MPNKNYIKGRRKEYKVLHEARAEGKIALRSAGSHSPIDVVVIDVAARRIRLVQCKPDSMSQKEKDWLLSENSQLNGAFFCKFEIV